ncbi:LytR C-terminal domain-containing protein [Kibdelosporangium persicum]|uniref:LytR family transcriptional regulator n=1 Tax=Kibdelosporangium persicum TaxID=2698649 RepID=A0ABX2FK03_9PSEU|nr:LytR C-terminal domain-containing protein [Kibdelosporangium persicum]NRN71165.1 LytR family transcriptional regulator [Kibdelosporangium persicum]
MSTPEQAGPTRPARLAGIGLLALALIALVIGLIQLFGGDNSDPGAQPAPPSSESQPPPPPLTDTATSAPPAPPTTEPTTATSTVPPAPPTSAPTSAAPPTAPPPQTQPPNRSEPVRVYNNSFIENLADRAAADFRSGGWNVVATGNHQGRVYVTTVYYRPGTAEEAQAKELGQQFNLRVEPRFEGIQAATPGIIVIVTKEYVEKKSK